MRFREILPDLGVPYGSAGTSLLQSSMAALLQRVLHHTEVLSSRSGCAGSQHQGIKPCGKQAGAWYHCSAHSPDGA